jgi:hypothetical protein
VRTGRAAPTRPGSCGGSRLAANGVRCLFSPCRDCRLTDGRGLHQHQVIGRVEQPEAFSQNENRNE